ncbi:MAG TPA: hypothetical protein VFR64_08775 [Methylomirabilota bacterium]|nr:hypothetical protein [Methylomirabilota bacterium]
MAAEQRLHVRQPLAEFAFDLLTVDRRDAFGFCETLQFGRQRLLPVLLGFDLSDQGLQRAATDQGLHEPPKP